MTSVLRNPVAVSSLVTLSYLGLYTAYDKVKKTLVLQNLVDLCTLGKGLDWTLVELNKAISLSGLTTMLLAYFPYFEDQSRDLIWISLNMLWAHSAYSIYKFQKMMFGTKSIKNLSAVLGIGGHLALVTGYFGYINEAAMVLGSVVLGVAHFWTMEIDYKWKLQVRPYAYLPFPLAAAALAYKFWPKHT